MEQGTDLPDLYESDFVLWTEHQARALRQLTGVTNSLDVSRLAEEIEDLGKRDTREVESLIRRLFEHLLRVAHRPAALAAPHWRAEIIAFHDDVRRAFAPSMRQKIDVDALWQSALASFVERAGLDRDMQASLRLRPGQDKSPLGVERFVAQQFDLGVALSEVVQRLEDAI